MVTRTANPRAVEDGLRSMERLLEEGELVSAELAMELLEPGLETLVDSGQLERWRAACDELRRRLEAAPSSLGLG